MSDPRQDLISATKHYRNTERAHRRSRDAVVHAVVAALRAGVGPTEVANLSPFTAAYVRKIAREHGIGPAR